MRGRVNSEKTTSDRGEIDGNSPDLETGQGHRLVANIWAVEQAEKSDL
jgi:hypothetical protein